MLTIEQSVREIEGLTPESLTPEILQSDEPLLLKGIVSCWPLVKAAGESTHAAAEYLRGFYEGTTVGAFSEPADIDGRVFYNDDMSGFNYQRSMLKLDQVLDDVLKYQDEVAAPMFYVGSTTVDNCLPGFRLENDVELGGLQALASIWLGNRSRIAAHFDVPDNLACVAAGQRRFTLFPPNQLPNLYVGPLDFNPAGQAISLVDFADPDFEQFPRFATALKHAQVAEMQAGDAIFIPSMWWHHEEAMASFNVLINYWLRRTPAYLGMPMNVLNHGIMAIRELPPEQKAAWQEPFRYYVFESAEATAAHIPEQRRGMLAPHDDTSARRLRAEILNNLNR